jgi:hypothetical protein
VWANDAIQAARLGLGEQAYQGMKTMLGKYQNYPNGFTNNTNGVFEYFGVHLSATNESLLQSYNDKLRVYPAVPNDAGFVGRFTLAAKGGFLVSSEREAGETKYVGIKSLNGNPATVSNPWGTQEIGCGPSRAAPSSSPRRRPNSASRRQRTACTSWRERPSLYLAIPTPTSPPPRTEGRST